MEKCYNWAVSSIGRGFNQGYGMQCMALIYAMNQELGLGLDVISHHSSGGAKYVSNNSAEPWEKHKADPNNVDSMKEVWNNLPNGSILIFTNSGYGHIAIKSGPWLDNRDTINQNVGAQNSYVGNSTRYWKCSGPGCGFIEGWCKKGTYGGSQPSQPSEVKPNTDNSISGSLDEALKNNENIIASIETAGKIIELIKNMLNELVELAETNMYDLSHSRDKFTNQFITISKDNNMMNASLNEDVINSLLETISKIIKDGFNAQITNPSRPNNSSSSSNNSGQPQSTVEGAEGTIEEKITLITKICLEKCPTANSFGIAGLVGNFVGETGVNPKSFEADFTGLNINSPDENHPSTAEDLYGSWDYFQNRVYAGFPLNKSAYYFEGKHWIGVGLGQWTGPRSCALYKFAGKNMWTVKSQMDFAFSKEEGQNAEILKQCLSLNHTIADGVEAVYKFWERANVGESYQKRLDGAKKWHSFIEDIIKKEKG